MTIKVAIDHYTGYRFDRMVNVHPHVIRLRPAPHSRTPIEAYSLKVTPEKHFINWQQDPFGNYLARFVFPDKTASLSIQVELIASMTVINPFDFFLDESAETIPFEYDPLVARDLRPYLEVREDGPELQRWIRDNVDTARRPSVDFLVDLNQRLQAEIKYLIRMEAGVQGCDETLLKKSGSCRDSAWLLVQICRHLGLAARFTSGYLVQLTADMKALDGPSGPEEDFTDLHAWTEVFLPGAGWVGLDPTSGLFAGEGHIPLACTPEPASAAPVTGSTSPCEVEFDFHNRVRRIHEDPRVTRPYHETQWQEILNLGERVDRDLEAGDVRLTMGGEPTFVSIDDMQGQEWNTAALGEAKRQLAGDLLERLRARFGPGGLLHFGQGKWYPGEPLPRWSLSLIWRTDGEPLWQDPQWLGDESATGEQDINQAEALIRNLAGRLGLDPDGIMPAFEDIPYYLSKEGRLPENVDPLDNKLKDPLERQRLQRLFHEGIQSVRGYALPLRWQAADDAGHWKSSRWRFHSHYMFLLPGDSPMGLRLPLESLPWEEPRPHEFEADRDPFEDRDELPPANKRSKARRKSGTDSEDKVVHTALCVEPRHGRLYVFMPPVSHLEPYLELIGQLEQAAAECGVPVVIEGYEPPRDHRIHHLRITPDPGVIEVNVHPAGNWRELREITETLYAEARQARLGTEKFMLDGRHTGTGGGNHITLGGPTPGDSPFLRRPDLLRSLVTYWQHHPCLSYLFSGLFIGPTSQAPRVDEARDDNLYELEIAMERLPHGDTPQPWLVDRILRNLLVDLTGNTHRAEFCIDKLYSPDTATGRLGLVELRAFEMPPHARMSLLQMLLLRGLVAHFWRHPYQRSLIRWGTELHDRFMLPHFIWQDLKQVIDDLRAGGYAFDLEWFEVFREFRFPHIGTLHAGGMRLELHNALEPWHVLGEETSAQGTSRYVDATVERIQVSVHDMAGNRYILTCNGRKVPLQPTATRGHFVAGVRFKAWEQAASLHPTIKAHVPLVFDIVDTENGCSIGGCTYYVSHPGGRNYETFPVNASEAEARRVARFLEQGMTQGRMSVPTESAHPDQPLTLDLRAALPGATD